MVDSRPDSPETPEVSDWRLLELVAEGDGDAFRHLVERHQERLIRLCERLLRNREEALDAAQEVLLKAFRKAGQLRPKGELYTWLYRVATNHCLNQIRRRRIVRFVPFVPSGTAGSERGPVRSREPRDRAPDAQTELEQRERWAATRRAIGALPPNQRAVLVLIRFEGLSYRRTAEVLGITEGAVESRLVRAMRRLERQARRESQESAGSPVSPSGRSRRGGRS